MTTQHQWPVELSHGPVTLRPWRLQDRRAWNEIRQRNAAWTAPWDSTRPPDSIEPPLTFAGMVRQFNRRARLGQMLPFAVDYRPDGQAWVLAGQLTTEGVGTDFPEYVPDQLPDGTLDESIAAGNRSIRVLLTDPC